MLGYQAPIPRSGEPTRLDNINAFRIAAGARNMFFLFRRFLLLFPLMLLIYDFI